MKRNERLTAANKCAEKYTDEKEKRIARTAFMDGCEFESQGEAVKGEILATLEEEPVEIDFKQELYNHFGQVKDFTLGMRIGQYFYNLGQQSNPNPERKLRKVSTWVSDTERELELEKEMIAWHKKHFNGRWEWEKTSGDFLEHSSQLDLARHFYELGRQSKEQPVCGFEPKFNVGDRIQFKGFGHNEYTIAKVNVDDNRYVDTYGNGMDMSYTDANFELVKEQPVCEGFCDELDEAASIYTDNLLEKNKAEGTKITPLSVYHAFIDGSQWQKEQKPAEHLSVRDEFDLDGNPKQKPSIFPPGLGEVHFNPISSKQILSNQKPVELGEEELIGQTVPDKQPVCEGLEEEIQNQIYNHFFDLNGIAITGTTAYASVEDMVYIAHHFYELGRQSKEQPVCKDDEKYFSMLEGFLNTCWGEYFLLHERDDFQKWVENRLKPACGKTEVCEGLEEAARLFAIPHYMKDIDKEHIEEYPYDKMVESAFKAGAEWMRGRMMKEAVEAHVSTNGMGNKYLFPNYNDDFKDIDDGDKVRIIVIKKD